MDTTKNKILIIKNNNGNRKKILSLLAKYPLWKVETLAGGVKEYFFLTQ